MKRGKGSLARKVVKIEAEAQCVGCGHKSWFGPGSVEPGSVPFCSRCHNPMASTGKVRTVTVRP